MFSLFGKLKTYLLLGLSLLLPILYILGRKDGRKVEQTKMLSDELDTANRVSDFYKKMAEHEQQNPVSDRRSLVERLRNDGL